LEPGEGEAYKKVHKDPGETTREGGLPRRVGGAFPIKKTFWGKEIFERLGKTLLEREKSEMVPGRHMNLDSLEGPGFYGGGDNRREASTGRPEFG